MDDLAADLDHEMWWLTNLGDIIKVDNRLLEELRQLPQSDERDLNIELLRDNKRRTMGLLKEQRARVQWLRKNKSDEQSKY